MAKCQHLCTSPGSRFQAFCVAPSACPRAQRRRGHAPPAACRGRTAEPTLVHASACEKNRCFFPDIDHLGLDHARSRSRDFLPQSTFEARFEGTPTRSLNKKSAGSAKSRPQDHYPDPNDCRRHHGGFSSKRTGRIVSTLLCAVGTSPTAVSRTTLASGGARRGYLYTS